MTNEIEKMLEEYKVNHYEDISIPDNIDAFIEQGIQQKKRDEKTQWRRRFTVMAACFAMILFLTTIRISPAFASYVSDIPGLDYVVKLVNFDKGLQLAVENNFVQPIGISDTHEDISLTVDNIIVDESRMIIFYTLENKGDHAYLQMRDVALRNEKGEGLPVSFSFGGFAGINFNEKRKNSEQIDISFQPGDALPDILTFEVKLSEAKQSWETYSTEQANRGNHNIDDEDRFAKLTSTWKIDIPIDKEKFKNHKEVYEINKSISIHNQRIEIQQFVIHPTRMALDVVYNENNPLKIFSIENLRITDEKGAWQTISNGITASHLAENKRRYYFQSGYFTYPKELYVEGEGIYALEKDQLEVVVDLEHQKLLKAPDDRIALQAVLFEGDRYMLHFQIPRYKGSMHHDIFNRSFKDGKGQEFESNQTASSDGGEDTGYSDFYYYLPSNVEMDNIITLKIDHYPNLIEVPFKVRIK